jgi:hypothetical protein
MDTSIIISAISTFIACCALRVANKAYLNSKESRKADKFMNLCIQVVELTSKAKELKNNSQALSKVRPTEYNQDANERLNYIIDINEALHKKMYEDHSHLTEKDLNDMAISILNIKGEIDLVDNKIKKITEQT